MTADEHLAKARDRALEFLSAGDHSRAVTAMVGGLGPRTDRSRVVAGMRLLMVKAPASAIKAWIEGFK